MDERTIVVLEGEDTGQELLEESLRLLSATSEFTDEVIRRTRTKLEVWSTR